MIRKRVVRVLVYDGPVDWVNKTLDKSWEAGSNRLGLDVGTIEICNASSICYDDAALLPEGE